ncbi:MAG: hydrogenase small subunit [Planctomycetota bacterium]|jgi:hydrogenase small subunit
MSEIVEIPAVWLQGAACSGCVVTLLNSLAPDAASIVLRELASGKHVSLKFIATAMAGQGYQATQVVRDETVKDKGNYVLIMDGSLQLGDDAFATFGGEGDEEIPLSRVAADLARNALAVVAMGTCASYGGIPAGAPNPTEAVSMEELLVREGIEVPLVNIPGCPPHPDWLVGTLAAVAMYGLGNVAPGLDEIRRPLVYYGKQIHETCPRRADFDAGRFAKTFGDPGCMYELGCKGPVTYADCPTRMWNSGTNWCIGAGSPCHGCVEPGFPDDLSPLYRKIDEERLDRFRLFAEAPSSDQAAS